MLGIGEVRVTAVRVTKEKLRVSSPLEVQKNINGDFKRTLEYNRDSEFLIAEKCANKLVLGSHQIQQFITHCYNKGSSLNLGQFIIALDRIGFNDFPSKTLRATFDSYNKIENATPKIDIFEFAKGFVNKYRAIPNI